MSECGVCLYSDSDCSDWEFQIEDISEVTLSHDQVCCECNKVVAAGQPIEEARCYDNEDVDDDGEPVAPHAPVYTCLVCAEIATAFYCDGRMWYGLWGAMEEVMGDLNSSCFERLQTPAAKAELQRRWMLFKGILGEAQ